LKKSALVSIAIIAAALVIVAFLQSGGFFEFISRGLGDTPIRTIVSDPAAYDGKNVTVIGSIGSRETTTFLRSSLTIMDREGYYIDLLKPVPSWLKYDIEMPFMITGTFTYYQYKSNDSQSVTLEEGYGLVPLAIEKVFNFVH
jgi:hypothetical protein